jgi:hypothetical protein
MITMARVDFSLPAAETVAVNTVFDHFRTNVFYGGLTCASDRLAACGRCIIQENGLIGNAAAMGRVGRSAGRTQG